MLPTRAEQHCCAKMAKALVALAADNPEGSVSV